MGVGVLGDRLRRCPSTTSIDTVTTPPPPPCLLLTPTYLPRPVPDARLPERVEHLHRLVQRVQHVHRRECRKRAPQTMPCQINGRVRVGLPKGPQPFQSLLANLQVRLQKAAVHAAAAGADGERVGGLDEVQVVHPVRQGEGVRAREGRDDGVAGVVAVVAYEAVRVVAPRVHFDDFVHPRELLAGPAGPRLAALEGEAAVGAACVCVPCRGFVAWGRWSISRSRSLGGA